MTLQAIKYGKGKLEILDQLLLPDKSEYINILSVDDAWKAIKNMQVRGAPAIAIVGCLSIAVELFHKRDNFQNHNQLLKFINDRFDYLLTSRPTAVNLRNETENARKVALELVEKFGDDLQSVIDEFIERLEQVFTNDVSTNISIGRVGADEILNNKPLDYKVSVLTHCNTGSLATAGYGTALGIIRQLAERRRLKNVYFTETRPYNQGSRLTAYELLYENIPSTLICDNMVGWLLKTHKIDAVITGADRVAANGDTANKIGTYSIAVLAKEHQVPFYIAAPLSSCHVDTTSGDQITVELRPASELASSSGAPKGVQCWNPSFDITPASLITGGIITEKAVLKAKDLCTLLNQIC